MKRFFLFVLFIISHLFCFSQRISGHYGECEQFIYKPFDFQIDLFFFERGTYMIYLTDKITSDDDEYVIILSNGRFTQNDNKLFLTDDIENYTLVFNLKDGRLLVDKAFCFLKDLTFCFLDSIDESRVRERSKNNEFYFSKEECNIYNKKYRRKKNLNYGWYGNKYELLSCSPNYQINMDGTFVITYKKIVISEGLWQRKKNVLILTDKTLQFPLYLLIGDNCLLKKVKSKYISIPFISETTQ